MRRIGLIVAGLLLAGLLIALPAIGSNGSSGTYQVRGIFDNGSFVVSGEEVRVAGAKVGTIQSVDVSSDDEIVSLEGGPHAVPGKAVVVMQIDNPGFKDFRTDASCLIRPQSLIGEKYVDCTPTQPRAPGTPPPPPLAKIPDGQPGSGQYLLPLENNGTTVDLDLIQNIQRMPYRDRFRLILNSLGAGLAGRGQDLGEIIDRANPALRQTDRVLNILAQQSQQLASLASNSAADLEPLARNRTHVTGFFHNAAIAAQASAERGSALEAGLRKFPQTLHQVRLTMTKLKAFADQGTPLFTDLNAEGKDLSKATQKLTPFANLAIPAFQTLGDAAQSSGPKIAASDPVLADLSTLGSKTGPISNNLASLLDTFTKTGGVQNLLDFIYFSTGAVNGFDNIGHLQRGNLQITACQQYQPTVFSGCEAFFQHANAATATASTTKKKKKKAKKARASFKAPKSAAPPNIDANPNSGIVPLPQIPDLQQLIPPLEGSPPQDGSATPDPHSDPAKNDAGPQSLSMRNASMFLAFLLGGGA
jgi:phospholipid/cholesterol/gamma-HCH transport system substrate-binding protein